MFSAQLIADTLRVAKGADMAPPTAAVIVAAGSSTRMGKDVSKQLLELGGIPVLARTLLAFEKCGYIDEIVVVTRPEDKEAVKKIKAAFGITKLQKLAMGGATRAESVKNGFSTLGDHVKYVAIHDGARCLITPKMIQKVLRAAYRHKAASAATHVVDTVKLANKRGFITQTIDRSKVFLAQTPQVFHTDLYRAALANADEAMIYTDDNQLLEHINAPVKLVDCGAENLKITTPEDILRAEMILATREGKK